MSPIDVFGKGTAIRAPSSQPLVLAARTGKEKASAMQPTTAVRPGAPVETTQAVPQPEAGTRSTMPPDPPPTSQADRANAPVPPITAVLLHELRLQQELADLQAKKDQAQGQ